ncbi:MAG: response regulator transcription factor [Chloroflexi bacterium]|nr:response regulator transcription factor [Chloroflexota bacterium]
MRSFPPGVAQSLQTMGFSPIVQPITAVIVDDSLLMRQAIGTVLSAVAGCAVVGEGANGLEALDLTRSLRPSLLVMDVHMPRMGGLEALRLIRAEMPATQIALVTAELEPEVRQLALAEGAVACLEKGPDLWNSLTALVVRLAGPVPSTEKEE